MKPLSVTKSVVAVAVVAALAGCSSWHQMDKTEGTLVGGAGGAVAGAVVGGPVGAVVGGVGGAYVGNEVAGKDRLGTSSTAASTPASQARYDSALVRNVQQALNDRGYNAGAADGQWGPATEDAVKRFQQVSGLPATGELEQPTLAALGVARTM